MPQSQTPSWDEIAQKLGPDARPEDYHKLQLNYFMKEIAPHVREGYSVEDTWDWWSAQHPQPGATAKKIGSAIGDFAVSSIGIGALTMLTGPLSAGLTETLVGGGRLASAIATIGANGMAVGTYDALRAKDGDRVNAGLHGAMSGALQTAGFELLGMAFRGATKATAAAMEEKALTVRKPSSVRGAAPPETGFTHRP